jgi:hypothetical protein
MPDPIKKSTTYDPSTGETTFKASWSGISRGPITPKGTQRTVAARQEARSVSAKPSPTTTVKKTSGEREAVSFKSPTPAGVTSKAEIKAGSLPDKAPKTPLKKSDIYKIKTDFQNKKLSERFPGVSLDVAKRKHQKEIEKERKRVKKNEHWRSTDVEENRGAGGSTITNKACSSC